jgi:hypothetical protein
MELRGWWRPHAWRPWWAPAVEAAMEDGAAAIDLKDKGAATAMEDGDEGQWRMEEPLPPWRRELLPSIWRRELPPLSRKEEAMPSRPTSSLPASSRHRRWAVLTVSDDLASDILTSSPMRCTHGFRRPRVVALTSSHCHRCPRVEMYEEREGKNKVKKKEKISFGEHSKKIKMRRTWWWTSHVILIF